MGAFSPQKLRYRLMRFLGLITAFFIPVGAFLFVIGANGAAYLPTSLHVRKGILSDGIERPYLVSATLAAGMLFLVGGFCFSLLAWSGELDGKPSPPESEAPE